MTKFLRFVLGGVSLLLAVQVRAITLEKTRECSAEVFPLSQKLPEMQREELFDSLLIEALPNLQRYGLWLTQDSVQRDDLVQDTVVKALSRRQTWDPKSDASSEQIKLMSGWLKKIALNLYKNRGRDIVRPASDQVIEYQLNKNSQPSMYGQEASLILEETLRMLSAVSAEQRTTLAMLAVEGLTDDEVGEVLQVAPVTVRTRAKRAREILQQDNKYPPRDTKNAMSIESLIGPTRILPWDTIEKIKFKPLNASVKIKSRKLFYKDKTVRLTDAQIYVFISLLKSPNNVINTAETAEILESAGYTNPKQIIENLIKNFETFLEFKPFVENISPTHIGLSSKVRELLAVQRINFYE